MDGFSTLIDAVERHMSCRTGPLRVERPLRGVYAGLAGIISIGPPVGRDDLSSDQREDYRYRRT
jgi:hypothetical protein